jgi:glycosyltransferase involved in cell wall biosynthesis
VRLLFVKHSLAWPRSSGHDVHTFYMMKACAGLGHDVALATVTAVSAEALDGLALGGQWLLDAPDTPDTPGAPVPAGTALQRRFRSFWGVPERRIAALHRIVTDWRPDAVIVGGLDALPYLPGLRGTTRIWYAADEWVLHHLSQLEPTVSSLREHLRAAAVKGLYERTHRHEIDRVWVVSDRDRHAMRWIAGVRHVDVLPNGVDGDFFAPVAQPVEACTAVFWGRLDFGPNIQALEWFFTRVWPLVRQAVPSARFTIIGFNPGDAVRKHVGRDGIALMADVPDLRAAVQRHAVAALPFISGAGIKNKLLEAAALGVPIVCTPTATLGLRGERLPLAVASTPAAFAAAIVALWSDPARRAAQSGAAREWVVTHHTWTATAKDAMDALRPSALHPNVTSA